MTKLFISFPGQRDFKIYQVADESRSNFSFVSFNGEKHMDLPVTETKDRSFQPTFISANSAQELQQDQYERLVATAIYEIRQKRWGKVVTSRFKRVKYQVDPVSVFEKAVERYSSACVYLFTHPGAGTWLGATPEVLLQGNSHKVSSMSLAGTREKGQESDLGTKERQEQQMVTEFIKLQFFKEAGLRGISISGPDYHEAGNLIHFKTEITARPDDNFSVQSFLKSLHPTPAVAGLPRKESLEFLENYESYPREFYTGYLGFDGGDHFQYFVNLRCMQFLDNEVLIYAGGGITHDSDPTAEWEETEAKMQTMQSLL